MIILAEHEVERALAIVAHPARRHDRSRHELEIQLGPGGGPGQAPGRHGGPLSQERRPNLRHRCLTDRRQGLRFLSTLSAPGLHTREAYLRPSPARLV